MKRLALFLSVFISIQLSAQEGPKVASAILATKSGDLSAAKTYIDEAANIIGTKDLSTIKKKTISKFYYYSGLINFRIYTSEDEAIKKLDPEALDKAYDNFIKLLEYEKSIGKERFTNQTNEQLPYVANVYAQRGIDKSTAKDYIGAYDDFLKTYEMKKNPAIGTTDTAMLYNAAIMAQNAKLLDKAIKINEDLMAMGYKAVEFKATDVESGEENSFASAKQRNQAVQSGKFKDPKNEGDIRSDILLNTANLYRQNKDTAAYDRLVKEGRAKFPENDGFIRAELQQFLEAQEFEKALVNLDAAISAKPEDPSSKVLYYIKGYILHTSVKDVEKAIPSYQKAASLDPNYIDPLYMNGLIYIDKANAITEKMNKLKLSEKKKYDALQAEQKKEFETALPFFEKVYAINPKDGDTLRALKEVYYKLKMREKQMKIMKELEVVEAAEG